MSNQWEIDEWGSTSDLGWLPFLEVDEEVFISIYFTAKDNTDCFTAKDNTDYFTTKGEA